MRQPNPSSVPETMTPGCTPSAVIAELLRTAALAPSMHNTQPWRFSFVRASQTIKLYADPARMLSHSDPAGRAVHIACGAALFNLRLATAVAGREPLVRLLPDDAEPMLLAMLRLGGPHRADQTEAELHAAIPDRHTNRRPFSNRKVPSGVLAGLLEAAAAEGATLHLPDHAETARLLYLVRDAERTLLAEPGYQAELARWVGGSRDSDGIPDSALGPHDPGGTTPVRDFVTDHQQHVSYAWFEENPQLAVLATPSGSRADWLRAGQALQRLWLVATSHGIAACPLTQPLETPDAWLVHDPQTGCDSPQVILRLGYGLPVPATPRRPVSDILNEPHQEPG
jgi:nitroreductase